MKMGKYILPFAFLVLAVILIFISFGIVRIGIVPIREESFNEHLYISCVLYPRETSEEPEKISEEGIDIRLVAVILPPWAEVKNITSPNEEIEITGSDVTEHLGLQYGLIPVKTNRLEREISIEFDIEYIYNDSVKGVFFTKDQLNNLFNGLAITVANPDDIEKWYISPKEALDQQLVAKPNYIIVVPNERKKWESALSAFVNHKKKKGYIIEIVDFESINNTLDKNGKYRYRSPMGDPVTLWNYLQTAYYAYAPSIIKANISGVKYVLLFGNEEVVPGIRLCANPVWFGHSVTDYYAYRTDAIFTKVTGKDIDKDGKTTIKEVWNNNGNLYFGELGSFPYGDGYSLLVPDFEFGRIPVNTPAEAKIIAKNIIDFENNTSKGPTWNNLLLSAGGLRYYLVGSDGAKWYDMGILTNKNLSKYPYHTSLFMYNYRYVFDNAHLTYDLWKTLSKWGIVGLCSDKSKYSPFISNALLTIDNVATMWKYYDPRHIVMKGDYQDMGNFKDINHPSCPKSAIFHQLIKVPPIGTAPEPKDIYEQPVYCPKHPSMINFIPDEPSLVQLWAYGATELSKENYKKGISTYYYSGTSLAQPEYCLKSTISTKLLTQYKAAAVVGLCYKIEGLTKSNKNTEKLIMEYEKMLHPAALDYIWYLAEKHRISVALHNTRLELFTAAQQYLHSPKMQSFSQAPFDIIWALSIFGDPSMEHTNGGIEVYQLE